MQTIAGKTFDYPVYVDIEEKNQLHQATLNAVANAFCRKIKEAEYTPGLYCSTSYINAFLSSDFPSNACQFAYGMWQYGIAGHPEWDTFEVGSIPGVSGQCDLNYCYKTYESSKSDINIEQKTTLEQILQHVASIDEKLK